MNKLNSKKMTSRNKFQKYNNNNNYIQTNTTIPLLEICEKIFDNDILKYKYTFFDILLNEWLSINKALLTDKINDLENINSLFIYNCHKYLIYTILKIANKFKIKIYYDLFYIYNKSLIQKKLIIIRKLIFEDLKNKINEENETKNGLNSAKKLLMSYLMNNNIQVLSKENLIKTRRLLIKLNKDNKIYGKINLNISFIKWGLIINKFNNKENIIHFYLSKIKFFQCISFVLIYKRKLRHIYNLFINKIGNGNNTDLIQKNKIKNQIFILSLLNPINKYIINKKMNILARFTSYCYLRKEIIFFIYIFSFFFNKFINWHKMKFMYNLKLYNNKIKSNSYLSLKIIQNFIFVKNYKMKLLSFYSIKYVIPAKLNIKSNKYKNSEINPNILYNKKNSSILINLIYIYYKFHNFFTWKMKQSLIFYFNKWKSFPKLYQYQKLTQYNNKIKKKFENYNNKNIIMKNKLQIIKNKANEKKKININIKETIKNNIKKKEKLLISEDIANVINNNKKLIPKKSNLKETYLNNLENLKNKNELIIDDLQNQINNLIKEIELLSADL